MRDTAWPYPAMTVGLAVCIVVMAWVDEVPKAPVVVVAVLYGLTALLHMVRVYWLNR